MISVLLCHHNKNLMPFYSLRLEQMARDRSFGIITCFQCEHVLVALENKYAIM